MSRSLSCILLALAVSTLPTGCATFLPTGPASISSVGEDAAVAQETQSQQPMGKYTVELLPERAEKQRVEVAFSGVPYVQQALEESGAIKKFRRMNIQIIRQRDGQIQKMRSSYDHARKQVPIEWDYALYPGDLIIVTEDPTTVLDDMVKTALGPLANMGGG